MKVIGWILTAAVSMCGGPFVFILGSLSSFGCSSLSFGISCSQVVMGCWWHWCLTTGCCCVAIVMGHRLVVCWRVRLGGLECSPIDNKHQIHCLLFGCHAAVSNMAPGYMCQQRDGTETTYYVTMLSIVTIRQDHITNVTKRHPSTSKEIKGN